MEGQQRLEAVLVRVNGGLQDLGGQETGESEDRGERANDDDAVHGCHRHDRRTRAIVTVGDGIRRRRGASRRHGIRGRECRT